MGCSSSAARSASNDVPVVLPRPATDDVPASDDVPVVLARPATDDVPVVQAWEAKMSLDKVVTQGDGDGGGGGDPSAVQEKLNGNEQIKQIHPTATVFGGGVVTRGDDDGGGASSAVQEKLNKDIETESNPEMAMLTPNATWGGIVTWGYAAWGGDSSAVQEKLNGNQQIKQIYSTACAFAALMDAGGVVTW